MTTPPANRTPRQQQLLQQAELHASRKEWDQARESFRALAAERPGDAGVLLQLSYVESLSGHYRAARDYTLAADRLHPREQEALHELLARLRTFNAIPELHACIERLKPLDRVPIKVLLGAAAQCSYLNEQDRALVLLDEARRADPNFPPTLIARSQVLMYLGRFDEAEAEVTRGLQLGPDIPHGWSVLSKLRKQTPGQQPCRPAAAAAAASGPAAGPDRRCWKRRCTRSWTISASTRRPGRRSSGCAARSDRRSTIRRRRRDS
jgi:predicted Zn-dependent protease